MGRTVAEGCLQTDNGITGKGTLEDRFAQTLFNCGEEVLGNGAADNLLGKLEAVAVDMLKSDPNIAELAAAAGLLLMSALDIGGLADGLSVCDLGNGEVDLNAEFILELGNYRVKMLFAETKGSAPWSRGWWCRIW